MPPMSKTPFSSKNPATLAKSFNTAAPGTGPQSPVAEVVCPLFNNDGSQCRKKCVGNFAYRSICEHIRRAHPDNWIPKLPASPETFAKMVGLVPRNNSPHHNANAMSNGGIMHHHHPPVQQMRKHSGMNPQSRKLKLSKSEEAHYVDTLSPPSSAHESDNHLPVLSVAAVAAMSQGFTSRFPPYEYHEEDDLDVEREIDDDMIRGHTETETEDEDYNSPYHQSHQHYQPFTHIHHHSMPYGAVVSRPNAQKQQQKRKRQSTMDSNTSMSSSSSFPSRWDELIEAATTRAFFETSMPPSPPQTAQTLPSICPNTPSGQSVSSDDASPKVECTECRGLVGLNNTFVCTECVSGFCEPCATENGKRGVCSECRVFGARWRRLKINVHS